MFKTIAMRFVRTFASGFIAGILAFLSAGVPFKDIADFKVLAMPLFIAGLTAGIAALDKAIRYEQPADYTIDSLPDEPKK